MKPIYTREQAEEIARKLVSIRGFHKCGTGVSSHYFIRQDGGTVVHIRVTDHIETDRNECYSWDQFVQRIMDGYFWGPIAQLRDESGRATA